MCLGGLDMGVLNNCKISRKCSQMEFASFSLSTRCDFLVAQLLFVIALLGKMLHIFTYLDLFLTLFLKPNKAIRIGIIHL